jgi:hypothetical protein
MYTGDVVAVRLSGGPEASGKPVAAAEVLLLHPALSDTLIVVRV